MMLSPVGGWGGAHAPAYSMMPSSPSGPLDGPLILNRREYSGQGEGACFSNCAVEERGDALSDIY